MVKFLLEYWLFATIGAAVVVILLLAVLLIVKRLGSAKSKGKGKVKGAKLDIKMAESDYRLITERILQVGGDCKSVLFAAAGISTLPVTIPVNIAIQLAGGDKRCLLIDLDLKRDAVAKVFGVGDTPSTEDFRPRPSKTDFEGLLIWPGHNFIRSKQMNIKALVEAAVEKFDIVLINAPYLDGSPDRGQIASAAQYCFVFSSNGRQAGRLAELVKQASCKIIGSIQIVISE